MPEKDKKIGHKEAQKAQNVLPSSGNKKMRRKKFRRSQERVSFKNSFVRVEFAWDVIGRA